MKDLLQRLPSLACSRFAAVMIHRLCEHDQEFALHRIADQLLKAGTQQRRAQIARWVLRSTTVQPCFSARKQQSGN
ncbi:hypothetical protein [Mesorhizobium sp. M1252]|uniref:hypothetical protein n=1 Tax=Mesorhizobium sp. M1252 TaxID=2957073 RepID=UPI00333A7BE9